MNPIFVLSSIILVYVLVVVRAIGPLGSFGVGVPSSKCEPSVTTASGTHAMHKGNNVLFNQFSVCHLKIEKPNSLMFDSCS